MPLQSIIEESVRKNMAEQEAEITEIAEAVAPREDIVNETGGYSNYEIRILTSDINGASTDGNVTASIWGERGAYGNRTKEFKLDKSFHNDFERGSDNTYKVRGLNVGNVEYVLFQLSQGSWHLATVIITNTDTGEVWQGEANQWLNQETQGIMNGGFVVVGTLSTMVEMRKV